jgi:hypothetical protein
MTTKKQLPADSDLAGVDKALKRAAKSAHTNQDPLLCGQGWQDRGYCQENAKTIRKIAGSANIT